ncbi:hypothetical protein BHM03_00007046 [Ensete ventricosum]|nr:hypothetical protein BHM03_00007046 [Ensete ventricosum]
MPSELFLSALGSFTSKICLAIVVSPPLRPVGPYNGDRATSTRSALRWQSEVDVCDAPIVTSMRVFLTLLDCSFKITPPGWWVPKVIPPTIKDYVIVAIVPSSSALGDSGTTNALAAMWSYFNVDSTMTTRRLVEVRKNYFIPSEYELHVPLPGERPYDAFPCVFSLSTDALEVGLRFSLYPVIEACLE